MAIGEEAGRSCCGGVESLSESLESKVGMEVLFRFILLLEIVPEDMKDCFFGYCPDTGDDSGSRRIVEDAVAGDENRSPTRLLFGGRGEFDIVTFAARSLMASGCELLAGEDDGRGVRLSCV